MALHRIKPTAAAVIDRTYDTLEVHVTRPPEYAGDSFPVESRRNEWGDIHLLTRLLVGRYTWMYESRDRHQSYQRWADGRIEQTDTGLREDVAVYRSPDPQPMETIASVVGLRRRTHFLNDVETERYEEWYDLHFNQDSVLGFQIPQGTITRATLRLSYHWYLDPSVRSAPWGEAVLWLHERIPPLTEDGARQLRPDWEAVRESRPLWTRAHDRIQQTPDTDPERWWIPQRTLTIPLPHSRLQAGWTWLRLGVRMEEPPPLARNPPPGDNWREYRDGYLGLYCDLTRTVLEVETGEPERRGTVVHVAKRESARQRAPSVVARLQP